KLIIGALAFVSIVAGLDFIYQRFSWLKKQRMTTKEIKDEYKQTEGDPTVKAKLRQIRAERGRQRMMAAVPDATVVITNPTHYAVALKYEKGMPAPLCVAKGTDAVALRIRSLAKENKVPVVENPPLARALHASIEIDETVPPEHYKAVAEVIGYVLQLQNRFRR
ncbi:MAG TPA: flagellar biosynthesis protein FlhB, partial [Rhodobacteraceae bacterium]|nr:flagellar biosynthesis protein FlhB [Paracoccaceae bacterium]